MKDGKDWKPIAALSMILLIAVTALAWITGYWVLTALPVGFLFGFFLEKADLCGSSAFSEAFMMRDWRKLQGIWVVIVTSMVGFTLFSAFGLINLNPKPLIWANYIVGGIVFGIGIVLAGGCVSGCLFKTGQGNINSMAGLVGIPLGVCAVAYGPLRGFNAELKKHVIKGDGGAPVTLSTFTGLPYWLLAVIIAAATLAVAIALARRKSKDSSTRVSNGDGRLLQRALTRSWKPWQSGIAIGILACLAYLSSAASGRNYPLGVTHGVMDVQVLLTDYPVKHTWRSGGQGRKALGGVTLGSEQEHVGSARTQQGAAGTHEASSAGPESGVGAGKTKKGPAGTQQARAFNGPEKHVVWWLVLEVIALVIGSLVSARMSGKFRFAPRQPDETVIAFFGGIVLGAGAAIASGCVVGNIMSGLALMSVGNMIFAVVVLLANWATTYFYMMGRQLPGR